MSSIDQYSGPFRNFNLIEPYNHAGLIPITGIYIYSFENNRKISIHEFPIVSFENSIHKSCPICLEVYVKKEIIVNLPCLHEYHQKCINEWIRLKHTCPLCRTNLI